MTPEVWMALAAAAGAAVPKLMSKMGWKVPDWLRPDPAPKKPATPTSPDEADRPLVAAYDWAVQAGAGVIKPDEADLRLIKAMKPHLDILLAPKEGA